MTGVAIKDQIKKLVELQSFDAEIYQLKRLLKEKPLRLEEIKTQYDTKKEKLKALEDQLKNMLVARKNLEIDLQTKEGDIIKANSQLSQLKTNKDYQTKLSEIEHVKADKSIIEEKILISYDETDRINKNITEEKNILNEEEKRYLTTKKEIDDSVREITENIKALGAKRQQAVDGIDKNILVRYEKILSNKDGLAIVPIKGNACGGCYMHTPPQVINELKMNDKIIYCEMCARMLYLDEDL